MFRSMVNEYSSQVHSILHSVAESLYRMDMDEQDPERIDEQQFRRLLDLFPIARSRDYKADEDLSRRSSSHSSQDYSLEEWQDARDERNKDEESGEVDRDDAFWVKLRLAAEKKVGKAEADSFCRAFHKLHRKLVFEELREEAAWNFINSPRNSRR